MHIQLIVTTLILSFAATTAIGYEMRTWTAMNGSKLEAAFVRYEHPSVVLQRQNGQFLRVNREQLSDEDWLYVYDRDPNIFTFWIKLGEVVARKVTVSNGGSDISLNYRCAVWNNQNFRDPEWLATKKVAEGVGRKMEFFVSNQGNCLLKYEDWSAIIPLPSEPSKLIAPPSIVEKGSYNSSRFGHFYRTTNGKRAEYGSTWELPEENSHDYQYAYWLTIWSNNENNRKYNAYHILAINASKQNLKHGNQILADCKKQFRRNLNEGTDVQYFVFDERAGQELTTIAETIERQTLQFHNIARYERILDQVEKRQAEMHNSSLHSDPSFVQNQFPNHETDVEWTSDGGSDAFQNEYTTKRIVGVFSKEDSRTNMKKILQIYNNREYGISGGIDADGNHVLYQPSQSRLDEYQRAKDNFDNARNANERELYREELENAKNRIWEDD